MAIDWSDRDYIYMLARTRREVRTAPIVTPGPGEHSGRCNWSRTGWALHHSDGSCTCQPTEAPEGDDAVPAFVVAV